MHEHMKGSVRISFRQLNNEDKPSAVYIAAVSLMAAVYAAAVTCFVTVSATEFLYIPVILICCAVSVLLNIIWNSKKSILFKIAAGVIPAAAALVAASPVRNGIALIGNGVLKTAGASGGKIFLPFYVTCSEAEYSSCVTLTVCILAVWITLFCVHLCRDNNCPTAILLIVLSVILNLMYGNPVSWGCFTASAVCTAVLIVKDFLENDLTGGRGQSVTAKGVLTVMCTMILIIGVCAAAASPAEYEKPQLLSNITDKISSAIYSARYGDQEAQVLPSGDFENLGNFKLSDKVMLKITADEHESLYLRGFVGSDYTGDRWEAVSGDALYEYADTFYWLHKDGIYGQSQLASATQELDKNASTKTISMSVKTAGADRRFYYTPYEMTGLYEEEESVLTEYMLDDSSITAGGWRGQKMYSFTTLENQVKRYPSLVSRLKDNYSSENLGQYITEESHYNACVYDLYTKLDGRTEKLMAKHLKKYSASIDDGEKHLNYTATKEIILDVMKTEVVYSEEIPQREANADFMTDFLEKGRTGYSVHYATAATLMFRYYGIPARYVEGYLITPDKAKSAKDGSEISITGKDAHAWTEYYQDGIGWIPFEATPPYMDVMEQPEMLMSSGMGGVSGQGGGAAMEMAQDNYEAEEPEKTEDEKDVPWNRIILDTALLLLAVLITIAAVRLIIRKKKLKELNASFEIEDRDTAVINLYAYIITLQALLDEKPEPHIYNIYQKAAFSLDQVPQDDKQQVADYKNLLLKRMSKECKLRKRFIYRWIKGIY